jgi:hypothetical protein
MTAKETTGSNPAIIKTIWKARWECGCGHTSEYLVTAEYSKMLGWTYFDCDTIRAFGLEEDWKRQNPDLWQERCA